MKKWYNAEFILEFETHETSFKTNSRKSKLNQPVAYPGCHGVEGGCILGVWWVWQEKEGPGSPQQF